VRCNHPREPTATVQQSVIVGITTLAGLSIGTRRIKLGMHTPEEVFFGSLIGRLCVAVFSVGAKRLDKFRLHLQVLLLFMLTVGSASLWVIGRRFNTESLIGQWGIELGYVPGIS
jgi:membrane-associated phospholipid phosphatase